MRERERDRERETERGREREGERQRARDDSCVRGDSKIAQTYTNGCRDGVAMNNSNGSTGGEVEKCFPRR